MNVAELVLVCLLPLSSCAQTLYAFGNFAGQPGGWGNADGTGAAGRFNDPKGIAVDGNGNNIYVADTFNHTIRKITIGGEVQTLAGSAGQSGSADGTGSAARFNSPTGVAVDNSGNVYVADFGNHIIRKITPAGVVTTLAGSAGVPGYADNTNVLARFNGPFGIAVDNSGNIFVADTFNNAIRKVTPSGSAGTLISSGLNLPQGVAVDGFGYVFVTDTFNDFVKKFTPAGLFIPGGSSASTHPLAIAVNRFVGSDAPGAIAWASSSSIDGWYSFGPISASYFDPRIDISAVAIDRLGYLYVLAEFMVWKVGQASLPLPGGGVSPWFWKEAIAGSSPSPGNTDGIGPAARFTSPGGVALDAGGNIYVADTGSAAIRKIAPNGAVTNVAGSIFPFPQGFQDGANVQARFNLPRGIAVDAAGNIYVADTDNHAIRKIAGGQTTTVAGLGGYSGSADGSGTNGARFYYPGGVAVDAPGNLYVADTYNHTIRKITSGGVVSTLAGSAGLYGSTDGTNDTARFWSPTSLAVDGAGFIYVTDTYSHTVRRVSPAGVVSTIAGSPGQIGSTDGTGAAARFNYPQGIAVDTNGVVYVCDTYSQTIRRIATNGNVITIGGTVGVIGGADGIGAAANFSFPQGLAVDSTGHIYVADTGNNRISKDALLSVVSPLLFGKPRLSGGLFQAEVYNPLPGTPLVVEASASFSDWNPILTNSAAVVPFSRAATNPPSEFYRAFLRQ